MYQIKFFIFANKFAGNTIYNKQFIIYRRYVLFIADSAVEFSMIVNLYINELDAENDC